LAQAESTAVRATQPGQILSPQRAHCHCARSFSDRVTYAAGLIALLIGCDLNEASVHACPLLGVNIGPLLYAMGLAVWFVSLTVLAGLLALVVLVIIFIVRTLRARRAKVDATGAKA
jgi:Flp pilus assembly protein TadB